MTTELSLSSHRSLGAVSEFFADCLSTEGVADESDNNSIAELTTLVTAYAVGVIALGFSIVLFYFPPTATTAAPPAETGGDDDGAAPTESTPLSGTRIESSIKLTKRSPYKEIMAGFFKAFGLAFLVSAVGSTFGFDEAIVGVIVLTLYSLSTSLLLGLAFMEYVVYLHYYVLIKAAWTYTFIFIVLLSIAAGVGSIVLDQSTVYFSLAMYQLVVVLLNLISLVRQFQRTGRKAYNAIEISAMVVFVAAIASTVVLIPICTSSGGGCDLLCPLPTEIISPNAVAHVLFLVAIILYGTAKFRQVKLESAVVPKRVINV